MRRTCAWVVVAAGLVACPVFIAAQQITGMSKTATPAQPQTEADKKLKEIMSAEGGVLDADRLVPALQRFIHDYPDYPRLSVVYVSLLNFASRSPSTHPDKVVALADEAAAKYPEDPIVRRTALTAKLKALKALKQDDTVKAMAHKALESETDPAQLAVLAQADPDDAVGLLEKALDERNKNRFATPSFADLKWSYALSLIRAGRKDEGVDLAQPVLDQSVKEIAEIEALPKEDTKRLRLPVLRSPLATRYENLANAFVDARDYDKALQYAKLFEMYGDPDEGTVPYDNLRASIYARMGQAELELDSYARSYATSMDPAVRDKIRETATRNGRKPEEIFERARTIRNQHAQPFKPFELKTMDGETIALDSLKAKAVLVNFFFPT